MLPEVTGVGALAACSFWLIYRTFAGHGFWIAVLVFVGLSFVYKFGISPMFTVAASALCFGYKAVGIWLPLISYVIAAVLLCVDLRRDRLKRRVDPYNVGSIHDIDYTR
jgi:hypothetical protein